MSLHFGLPIFMMAVGGGYVIDNHHFNIYFRDTPATEACFTSTLATTMEAGQYSYYAAYPVPQSVTGTQAVFTLPATQVWD